MTKPRQAARHERIEQDAETFEQSESKNEWTKLKSSSAITYEFRTTKFVPTSGMPFETE